MKNYGMKGWFKDHPEQMVINPEKKEIPIKKEEKIPSTKKVEKV